MFSVTSAVTFILGVTTCYIFRKMLYTTGIFLLNESKFNILGFISVIDDLYNAKRDIDLPSKPGKIAVVTGGSRGIGIMIVKKLLQCDMEVIIGCRTTSAGVKAVLQIRESGVTSGRAQIYQLDNSSLKSVTEFANQIKRDYNEIHILINNAGIMFTPYQETKDGFEEQWQVNYLSHFLLTSLLLPLLKAGGRSDDCSRIINVTSCAHILGTINFDDINNKNIYIRGTAYAQSKLAQVIFTLTLAKLLMDKSLNIHAYSVHPGIVKTELFKYSYLNKLRLLMFGFKTPEQGAIPTVYTAIDTDIGRKNGLYINNCREMSVLETALDFKIQNRLFDLSLKQAGLDNFFQ